MTDVPCVRNLVGSQWLTDIDLSQLANLINKTNIALCFVLQHPTLLFSDHTLQNKLERLTSKLERAHNIMNIGRNQTGQSHIDVTGSAGGCRWTLLLFEAESSTWYYGDSLAWPFPSNPDCLVSLLRQVEPKTGVKLIGQNVQCQVLHSPNSIDSKHAHTRARLLQDGRCNCWEITTPKGVQETESSYRDQKKLRLS